jgi:hypothetical protein
MNKETGRCVFIGFCGVLGIQFMMTMKGIEPYPALFYPKFSTIKDTQVSESVPFVNTRVLFSDGSELDLNYRDILAEAHISHRIHMLEFGIAPKDDPNEENKPYHKFKIGNKLYEYRRTIPGPDRDGKLQFAEFLKRRIESITNRKGAETIEFTWHSREFVFGDGLQPKNPMPFKTRKINLETGEDV